MAARWTESTPTKQYLLKRKKRWRTHIHTFADTHTKQALHYVQAGNENANDNHTDIHDIYSTVCVYYIGAKDQNQKFIIIVVGRLHLLALCTLLFVIRFTRILVPSLSDWRRLLCTICIWFLLLFTMDNLSFTLSYTIFFASLFNMA